jgi:hypothetical protein
VNQAVPTTTCFHFPLAVAALADENDNRLATIHQHPTSPSDELSRDPTLLQSTERFLVVSQVSEKSIVASTQVKVPCAVLYIILGAEGS